jgi:hypothetical protein
MAFNPDVKRKIVRDKEGNHLPCVMCGATYPLPTRFTSSTRESGKLFMLAIDRSTEFLFVQTAIEYSMKYCGRICTELLLRLVLLAFQRAGPQTTNSRLLSRHWISAMSHWPDF